MKIILFLSYLFVVAFGYWLKYLNLDHLKRYGKTVPPEFEGVIEQAELAKMSNYTLANSRIGFIESILNNIVLLGFLFGGLLAFYDSWIATLSSSFILNGLAFFLLLSLVGTLFDIPFSLYRNFRLEAQYGFNTMTMKLWITDLVKSIALSLIMGAIVIAVALGIVQWSPAWWWLWVWGFLLLFGIFVMYIAPYVIEPLFFKFEPIKKEGLEEKIKALLERGGLHVSRVFQVDASRRSKHSNAYFTGIGRVKRIVLFDTLLEQMNDDEVLAVLAHEAGHWKKRHVLKRIFRAEAIAFCGLFLVYHLVSWEGLPHVLGLTDASFYARMVIIGFLGSIIMFPFTPWSSYRSRKDEQEADRFASELTGNPEALASALLKLSRENLSNLHPHPWYAKFYYSHPPVVERIRMLKAEERSENTEARR